MKIFVITICFLLNVCVGFCFEDYDISLENVSSKIASERIFMRDSLSFLKFSGNIDALNHLEINKIQIQKTEEDDNLFLQDILLLDSLENEGTFVGGYLTENNYWQGDVYLTGPVYVFDSQENPAKLKIESGSRVIPLTNESGIYLIEGSSILAENVYFGPTMENQLDYWQGINVEGRPSRFVFSENEVRQAIYGLYLIDSGTIRVSNSIFKRCYFGIYGLRDTIIIENCVFDDIFDTGVLFFMESNDPNNEPNSLVLESPSRLFVDGSTITGSWWKGLASHDYGLFIVGSENPNNAGIARITNTLITSSYHKAIVQQGWQSAFWQSNAFFNNYPITNQNNPFLDPNSLFLEEDPFEFFFDNGYGYWEMYYHIWKGSEIIDGGNRLVFNSPIIGRTTSISGIPDMRIENIGYHYPNPDYSDEGISLLSDLNGDGFVNYSDLLVLSKNWGLSLDPNDWQVTDPNDPLYYEPNSIADINSDGFIGLGDLLIMADEWLSQGSGEINNGEILVFVNGERILKNSHSCTGIFELRFDFKGKNDQSVHSIQIERDGKIITTIDIEDKEEYFQHFYVENSYRLKNHATYVFRAFLDNGEFITSKPYFFEFENPITFNSKGKYVPGEDLVLSFSLNDNSEKTYFLEIFNGLESEPNSPLFTLEFNESTDVIVPKEVFESDLQIYEVKIHETDSINPMSGSSGSDLVLEELITLDLNKVDTDYWFNTRAVISVGSRDLFNSAIPRKLLRETHRDLNPIGLNVVFIGPDEVLEAEDVIEGVDYPRGFGNLVLVSNWVVVRPKLWYHLSHGHYNLRFERERHFCQFGGRNVPSHLWSDYEDEDRPSGLERLLRHENALSLRGALGKYDYPLNAVIFDGCYHGKSNEIPEQLGIFSTNQPPGGSIYLGWKDSNPLYENPHTISRYGEYGTYRKKMVGSWTRKISFGSARENDCRNLLWGTRMRDNLYIVGANSQSSYWNTPRIDERKDSRY